MKKFFSAVLIAGMIGSGSVFAQQKPVHEIYSMMVFNFVKYIQWPDGGTGEFVIGIAGNNEMYKTMSEWYTGSKFGGRSCVIKKIESSFDAASCHVLFLDKSRSGEFEKVQSAVKGKSTLLITDKIGLGEKGSGINFKVVDNKLKFELNQKVLEASNLRVAGALTSMAILI
jgi:hypothetical protein